MACGPWASGGATRVYGKHLHVSVLGWVWGASVCLCVCVCVCVCECVSVSEGRREYSSCDVWGKVSASSGGAGIQGTWSLHECETIGVCMCVPECVHTSVHECEDLRGASA